MIYLISFCVIAISALLWRIRGGLWKDYIPANKIWYALFFGICGYFHFGNIQQEVKGNGKINLDIMIEKIENSMAKNVSKGTGLASVLERRYGLNPAYGSYG